jgi:hypothetical protein
LNLSIQIIRKEGIIIMEVLEKRQLHLYANEIEWKEITDSLESASITEFGKVRAGDLLKKILLDWARKNNQNPEKIK